MVKHLVAVVFGHLFMYFQFLILNAATILWIIIDIGHSYNLLYRNWLDFIKVASYL